MGVYSLQLSILDSAAHSPGTGSVHTGHLAEHSSGTRSLQFGSLQFRATDFGCSGALTWDWESSVWESTLSGYRL